MLKREPHHQESTVSNASLKIHEAPQAKAKSTNRNLLAIFRVQMPRSRLQIPETPPPHFLCQMPDATRCRITKVTKPAVAKKG